MVRIRYATIGDAEQVGQLMTELGYPTTVDAMKERLAMILADPSYVTFVADTGRCVIGVAGATLDRTTRRTAPIPNCWDLPFRRTRGDTALVGINWSMPSKTGRSGMAHAMSWSTAHCTAAARTGSTNDAGIPGPAFASSTAEPGRVAETGDSAVVLVRNHAASPYRGQQPPSTTGTGRAR